MSTIVYFLGACGILGAVIYAIGDVLLLAGKAKLENYPKLQPYAKILSGVEKMVEFPHLDGMAAVNPVTMFIVWMFVKRILPRFVQDWTEGAGFNIAHLLFFIFTRLTFTPEITNFTM